jgi:hypothetical protein
MGDNDRIEYVVVSRDLETLRTANVYVVSDPNSPIPTAPLTQPRITLSSLVAEARAACGTNVDAAVRHMLTRVLRDDELFKTIAIPILANKFGAAML